jgi:hypothetical protein
LACHLQLSPSSRHCLGEIRHRHETESRAAVSALVIGVLRAQNGPVSPKAASANGVSSQFWPATHASEKALLPG